MGHSPAPRVDNVAKGFGRMRRALCHTIIPITQFHSMPSNSPSVSAASDSTPPCKDPAANASRRTAVGRRHAALTRFRLVGILLLTASIAVLEGCATAHYPVNAPLPTSSQPVDHQRTGQPYDLGYLSNGDNSWSLFFHVSLSGGGARAAAMAYGVLEELADARLTWQGKQTTLFDEIDVVAGVSGGSIAGGYLALKGRAFLDEFPERFLHRDVQGEIVQRILSPSALARISSPRFGRSEVVAEALDALLFDGATYQSLVNRARRPQFYAVATDITDGSRFEFTQGRFDQLCSDLNQFPISRAVAASMAVPVVFSPVTLWKHGNSCAPKAFVGAPAARDAEYVHLMDGGLSDNLGVRSPLAFVEAAGGIKGAIRSTHTDVRRIVYLVVNARTQPKFSTDSSADVPGLLRSVSAVVDIPINRLTAETSNLMKEAVQRWRLESATPPYASGSSPPNIYLIELGFDQVEDPVQREHLLELPTSLTLEREQVSQVRSAARLLLRQHPEFLRLRKDLQISAPQH